MRTYNKFSVTIFCLVGAFAMGVLMRNVLPTSTNAITTVRAQEDRNSGSRRCSARTLKASYGIKFEGQKLNTGPFVSVSRITFDGVGQFTTNEIGRFNGNPVLRT